MLEKFFSILVTLSVFLILILIGALCSGCSSGSKLGKVVIQETTCVNFKDCISKMSRDCYTKAKIIKSTPSTTLHYYCE